LRVKTSVRPTSPTPFTLLRAFIGVHFPEIVLIHGSEQVDLDHNAALGGGRDELLETGEQRIVPLGQVVLVPMRGQAARKRSVLGASVLPSM